MIKGGAYLVIGDITGNKYYALCLGLRCIIFDTRLEEFLKEKEKYILIRTSEKQIELL